MKKKNLLALLAVPCALCCAFGMTACSDDSAKKNHTEEQWKAAVTADISESKSYSLSEEYDILESDGTTTTTRWSDISVYSDSANTYYRLESHEDNTDMSYLLKKGTRYYESMNNNGYDRAYAEEISAESFTTSERYLRNYISDAGIYLGMLETRYDEFVKNGSGGHNYTEDGVEKVMEYTGYTAENMEFSLTYGGKTHKLTAEYVNVNLDNETGVLDSVQFYHLALVDDDSEDKELMNLRYSNDYGKLTFDLPDLPEFVGRTFYLFDAQVDNTNYEEAILGNYNDHTHILQLTDGKTVTINADGTCSGDIEFNGISISTYTWTDENGALTVSNVNNAAVPASGKNTLNGGIVLDSGYSLALELDINISDVMVKLTLDLRYVQDDE